MIKRNKNSLKQLEELYKALGYKIRYEKGQFQAGYCLVKQQGVVVINKFYTTDVRINTLLDILKSLELEPESLNLNEKQLAFWEDIKKEIQPDNGIVDTSKL